MQDETQECTCPPIKEGKLPTYRVDCPRHSRKWTPVSVGVHNDHDRPEPVPYGTLKVVIEGCVSSIERLSSLLRRDSPDARYLVTFIGEAPDGLLWLHQTGVGDRVARQLWGIAGKRERVRVTLNGPDATVEPLGVIDGR